MPHLLGEILRLLIHVNANPDDEVLNIAAFAFHRHFRQNPTDFFAVDD